MKPTYNILIQRITDDEVTQLTDRDITADQAIDLMLYIQEHAPDTAEGDSSEAEDEEAEDEPERVKPAPATAQKKKAVKGCSVCGQPGHNRKTCPKAHGEADYHAAPVSPEPEPTESEEPAEPPQDHRSLRERVQELWEAGLEKEECYDSLPSENMVEIGAIYDDLERRRKD